MKLEHQINNNQDLFSALVSKSWQDESFKSNLIKSPIQTIENFIGKPVEFTHGRKQIVVEDQTNENIVYFNIPSHPNLDELELTEEQLEMLSGGVAPLVVYGICAGVGLLIGIASKL